MSDDLYDEFILDHYESPFHKGHLEEPTFAHSARNPLCGDEVRLELLVDDQNRVVKAYFDGRGCAISQAAASILCEHVEGKPLAEVRDLQAHDMLDLLQVKLTALRQRCGLLAFKVLKTIVYSTNEHTPPEHAGNRDGQQ